ncbi:MAG: ADP-ribosylglycohydrolase family protein, partial [Bacteroidota bacterium]
MTFSKEIIKSAIIGFAIGDALGVPYEFSHREERKLNPVTKLAGGGYWRQPVGTWSDDSSMVFCTMESLCTGYDLSDMGLKFHEWIYENYWTPHGKVFDKGNQTLYAIERIHKIIEYGEPIAPMPQSMANARENGNGSLMRILPMAFYLKNKPIKDHFKIIWDVSAMTHPHIRSAIACMFYTEFAIELLNGLGKEEAYRNAQKVMHEYSPVSSKHKELALFSRILHDQIWHYPEDSIKSKGYVLDSLEACIWCVMNSNDYSETLLKAVNLGDDTDTIAALAGGLAGLVYGFDQIPDEWINLLVKKEDILQLC